MEKADITSSTRFTITGIYVLSLLIPLPYLRFIGSSAPHEPTFKFLAELNIIALALIIIVFGIIVSTLILTFSSSVLEGIKLNPFISRSFYEIVYPAISIGILFGLADLLVNQAPISPSNPFASFALQHVVSTIPLWLQLTACSYTFGIEAFFRLCVFPLALLIGGKDFSSPRQPYSSLRIWIAIFITMSISSQRHYSGMQPGSMTITSLVLSNSMEIALCWLFLKRGFWTSSLARITTCLIATAGRALLL